MFVSSTFKQKRGINKLKPDGKVYKVMQVGIMNKSFQSVFIKGSYFVAREGNVVFKDSKLDMEQRYKLLEA